MTRRMEWLLGAAFFCGLVFVGVKGDHMQNILGKEPQQTNHSVLANLDGTETSGASQPSSPSPSGSPPQEEPATPQVHPTGAAGKEESARETATLGGGCFWCLEAVFQQLRGVQKVTSGYSGGHVKNPTYKQVCSGTTGHAEVVQIEFDPRVISYEELLEVFFEIHDPTTLNRQGNDVGPQYRSIVLYHTPQQRQTALRVKEQLERSGRFLSPIVTEIVPFEVFYPAEEYHQDYFRRNSNQPYCRAVISPKLEKFQKKFSQKLQKPSSETPPPEERP